MSETDEEIPKRIIVMKMVTYDTDTVIQQLIEDKEDPTLENVMLRIEEYALDDMSCGWGHKANLKELIFQDENGTEY